MYACICSGVTEAEVVDVVLDGARDESDVATACGAGTGCGTCLDRICDLISAFSPSHGRPALQRAG